MQEYNVIIEIDEDGDIKAETKGMKGEVCVGELDEILKGLDGEQSFKNKPEFYDKKVKENNKVNLRNR
ncbi:MAG: DUF2997 domain-containing protein [Campylobacterota bacterium]|nr:DUF2997 domain-containing protein [Campylobacterota bacterium]